MIIAVGNDHRGFPHKTAIKTALTAAGNTVIDCGCHGPESADYPDHALAVGTLVASGEVDLGIAICGSGIGVSIAANKVDGVRAALCSDREAAETTRRHNDSNVLCLSGDRISPEDAVDLADVFLAAEFDGGRHARRVDKITGYEAQHHH